MSLYRSLVFCENTVVTNGTSLILLRLILITTGFEMSIATQVNHSKTQSVPLQSLGVGEMAEVSSVTGSNHEVARLAEMGLRTGMTVSTLR